METITTRTARAAAPISSADGLVTANHLLAAEAGATILAQGGNALDAAIATSFAVGVVEPSSSGVAGRGYLIVHVRSTGESVVFDGHERAPLAALADMYALVDQQAVPTSGWGPQVKVEDDANIVGHRAVAVPGVVPALYAAHQRFGRLPWSALVEPAIALAEDGFEVSEPFAASVARQRAKLARCPAAAALFLPGGEPLAVGARYRNPDLAASLRQIAAEGPAALYTGRLARAIAEEMVRGGGILGLDDLAQFQPRVWDRPQVGSYRGYQVLTVPEATGGITVLQALNLLEGFEAGGLDPIGAPFLHLLMESLNVAFVDRLAVIDDPTFHPVPFQGLASKAFADARRSLISPDRALAEVTPGDAWPFDASGQRYPTAQLVDGGAGDHDTTHVCAVDREGTVVSLTQSIIDAYGSGVVVPGTGILLNSAMHNFSPVPGRRGSIAPWKRSAHYGTPVVVLDRDGAPLAAIGGAGGTKIVTGVVQALAHVLDHGWTMQAAVTAPRAHHEGTLCEVDGRIAPDVLAELRRLGHAPRVTTSRLAEPGFSRINGIRLALDGTATSGVDPFSDGGAAAPIL